MSQGKPKKLKNYIENEVKLDLEGLIEESDVSSEYPIPQSARNEENIFFKLEKDSSPDASPTLKNTGKFSQV